MSSIPQAWTFAHQISIQDIATAISAILTAYIAFVAHNFSRTTTRLTVVGQVADIVDNFNRAILESEENAKAIEELRPPPPGFNIKQEYLLFLYLNSIELAYRSYKAGLLERQALDGVARDCLSYFVTRREALEPMLKCFAAEYIKYMNKIFEREFPKPKISDTTGASN